MKHNDYSLRWLKPSDARAMARLESRVHPPIQRAGAAQLREQLAQAQALGTNLTSGLFAGRHLVGYMHTFLVHEISEVWDYYWDETPPGAPTGTTAIFVADFVIASEHRRAAGMMTMRLASVGQNLRALRNVPLCAFCTAEYRDVWNSRAAVLARAGWILDYEQQSYEPSWGSTLHWLRFQHTGSRRPVNNSLRTHLAHCERSPEGLDIGVIGSLRGWQALTPHWQRLLPSYARVLDTPDYLMPWSLTTGINGRLALIVVLRGADPVALLPLHITLRHAWGLPPSTCIEALGTGTQRAHAILDGNLDVSRALARYLLGHCELWDRIDLSDQSVDEPLVRELQTQAHARGLRASILPAPAQSWVSLETTWPEYLGANSKRQAALNGALNGLGTGRTIRLKVLTGEEAQLHGLDRYCELEQKQSSRHVDAPLCESAALRMFLAELQHRDVSATVSLLLCDDRPIAACITAHRNRRCHVLHMTPSGNAGDAHIRNVLLGKLIEAQFLAGDTTRIDLPVDPTSERWATATDGRVSFSVDLLPYKVPLGRRLKRAIGEWSGWWP